MSKIQTNIHISNFTAKCITDFLASRGIAPDDFLGDIAEEDEMYYNAIAKNRPADFAYFKYIESGLRTFDIMDQFLNQYFGGAKSVGSLLEFASGHGRATRFLIQSVPCDRVWASDIYLDAMQFQRAYFKTNAVQSSEKPEEFEMDRKFDLITAMSLFSHLPEHLFGAWLSKLASLLEKNGVLIITVREAGSVRATPNKASVNKGGILFEPTSESRTLSKEIYGLTAVTDEFVRKMISKFVSPQATVRVFPRGLYLNQTVYAISLRDPKEFPEFALNRPATGGRADNWRSLRSGQELYLSGWSVDLNEGHYIEAVDVFVNGEFYSNIETGDYHDPKFQKHFPGLKNKPVSFSVTFPANLLQRDDIVKFRVKSSTKQTIELYAPQVVEANIV